MASDSLYQALAGALSRPSKAYRAVNAATEAAVAPLQGYKEGLALNSEIGSAKFMKTPLSQIFGDASRIPFGLKPNNTVGNMMTVSKSMTGYIPPELTAYYSAMSNFYAPKPQQPAAPATPPAATATPFPQGTLPSTTPTDPNAGIKTLFGVNADTGNVASGAPVSGATGGGVALPAFPAMPLYGKAGGLLKDAANRAVQMGQFDQNQTRERFNQEQNFNQREQHHAEDIALNRGKAEAAAVKDVAPKVQDLNALDALYNGMDPLVKNATFIPLAGNHPANIAQKLGPYSPNIAMNQLRLRNQGVAAGTLWNRILANRYNDNERKQLQSNLVPGENDPLAAEKMVAGRSLVKLLREGKQAEFNAHLDALSGRTPALPPAPQAPGGGTGLTPEQEAAAYLQKSTGPATNVNH